MGLDSKARVKVWKVSKESISGFMVTEDSAAMVGSENAFVAVDKSGVYIRGPLSIIASSEQVIRGGIFRETPDLAKMIPSSVVTPTPAQLPIPPVAYFSTIAKSMPFILALVSGV